MNCSHCNAPTRPGADFCGGCGRRLEARPPAGTDRRTVWALRAVAVLLVVIVVEAIVGVAQIGPEGRANQAEKSLSSVRSDLTVARTNLGATTKERDDLKAGAAKLRAELDDSRKNVAFQSTQATTFKGCVAAIKALGEAPESSSEAVIMDLIRRLERECDAADRLL